MRISYDWLKQYLDFTESPEELSVILTSLGLEVEGIENYEEIRGGLKGVIVAEVLECWKHPNADKLSLTKVSTGTGIPLQVVCGAPNVAKGQKVFLATQGTILYPKSGEPITIKKGKIRGEVSEGMLCAEDELGLSDNHEGLFLLPQNTEVGKPAAEVLQLKSDLILEIGLTPNRADAMSHLGVAKDLLAWYRVHKDKKKVLKDIPLVDLSNSNGNLRIDVRVFDSQLCKRYSGICLSGIEVKESPEWLKMRIQSMGLNPINNIVDVTNFVMYEMGQPLHAFDYDRIENHSIHVKTLPEGTTFKSLDDTDRKLKATDLMICDGKDKPLCIAGVFGGIDSGIATSTNRIFIESANFNAASVRKSSMSHNLRTQSARCFEKGCDPNQTITALQRAVYLIQQTCPARVDSRLIDVYPQKIEATEISFNCENARNLSGILIDDASIKDILFAMDMEVKDLQNGILSVFVPTNKPDVLREADVVEEICRVYGLENISVPEKIQYAAPRQVFSLYHLRRKISEWLSSNQLNEIISLSLVKSGPCLQSGIWKESDLIFIHNTSNIQLNAMRPSICLGGLEAIQFNVNRQQTDLAFYEFGKEYLRDNGTITEKNKLGIWLYGLQSAEHWLNPKPAAQDFIQLKSFLEGILKMLKVKSYTLTELSKIDLYDSGVEYRLQQNHAIIKAGKVTERLTALYDLKKDVWFAEFDLDILAKDLSSSSTPFAEFSKFPQIKRDLALIVDNSITFESLREIAFRTKGNLLKELRLFDVYENEEQIGSGKKSYALSFTFETLDQQMNSQEIENLMKDLIGVYEQETGAKVRK